MQDPNCIFCKIINGDIPAARVFENDQVLSFLDINPWNEGHTLVVPKDHHALLHQCPPETAAAVVSQLGPIARAVIESLGAEGYNILNNNGPASGQEIEHLHFHIIPRRSGDGIIRHAPQKTYPEGRIDELAEQIKKALS